MPPQTPILTKKQQKASLSAKKGKAKVTIRNILATPFKKYWPLVSQEHAAAVHDAIAKHLPKIVPDKLKIPWQELKKITKQERKQPKLTRQGLAFGINDTSKAIEKGIARSILIANDVKPKLMVEHLLDLSVLLSIPVLVVPGLRDVLKRTCGISGIAFALTDTDTFTEFQLIVSNLHKKYPVPKKHINYERSLAIKDQKSNALSNESVIFIEDQDVNTIGGVLSEESVIVVEDQHVNKIGSFSSEGSVIVVEDDDPIVIEDYSRRDQPTIVDSEKSVYLYRDCKNRRVFVPGKSDGPVKNVNNNGFLTFTVDSSPEKKLYKSLKVRRIKGNNNRNKMKIGHMKKKKKKKM